MKHFMTILLAVLMALPSMALENRLYMDDFEIAPDSTVTVPMILANQIDTRGVQCRVTLPEGLSVVEWYLTDYSLEFGMVRYGGIVNDSVWSMGMYPTNPICLPPDTLAVILVDFKASSDFQGGEVIISRCRGSHLDNTIYEMDGDTVQVKVFTGSDPVVTADQPCSEHYYNLMGQPIVSPDDAPVAIVVTVMTDGSRKVRKVTRRAH